MWLAVNHCGRQVEKLRVVGDAGDLMEDLPERVDIGLDVGMLKLQNVLRSQVLVNDPELVPLDLLLGEGAIAVRHVDGGDVAHIDDQGVPTVASSPEQHVVGFNVIMEQVSLMHCPNAFQDVISDVQPFLIGQRRELDLDGFAQGVHDTSFLVAEEFDHECRVTLVVSDSEAIREGMVVGHKEVDNGFFDRAKVIQGDHLLCIIVMVVFRPLTDGLRFDSNGSGSKMVEENLAKGTPTNAGCLVCTLYRRFQVGCRYDGYVVQGKPCEDCSINNRHVTTVHRSFL